jgi:hypothetical protein
LVGQVGNEGQHAGVAGQPQQVLEVIQAPVPSAGLGGVTNVVTGKELENLVRGEVLQGDDPAGVTAVHGVQQGPAHLALVPEVLAATGQHYLGLAGRGDQQGLQVGGGGGVGDPLHQLVEPVQQQGNGARVDEVTNLRVSDVADVEPAQVLPDEVVQVRALLQGAQLDQERFYPTDALGQVTDQLAHQERLATAEVT